MKINEISFVFIGSIEKDCSLKDPVKIPRSPAGVNVPDDTILIFVCVEHIDIVEILTLISSLWPLLIVSIWRWKLKQKRVTDGYHYYYCRLMEVMLPILFSDNSLNHV